MPIGGHHWFGRTKLYWLPWELEGKRIETLKEVLPRISRVALVWDALGKNCLPGTQRAPKSLHMHLVSTEVKAIEDLECGEGDGSRHPGLDPGPHRQGDPLMPRVDRADLRAGRAPAQRTDRPRRTPRSALRAGLL
jgi:hypothetical protein